MQGVVVETFGAGNVPSNRPDLINEFKEAADRGIILLNITQCLKGSVRDAYAAGRVSFRKFCFELLPSFQLLVCRLISVSERMDWVVPCLAFFPEFFPG